METSISLEFADGEYLFALGLRQINEIQNACDAGIGAIFARIARGIYHRNTEEAGEIVFSDPMQAEYRLEDLTAVIRQGLIGGGRGTVDGETVVVDATRANQLIENYVMAERQPLEKSHKLAYAILSCRIRGFEAPDGAHLDKKKEATTD